MADQYNNLQQHISKLEIIVRKLRDSEPYADQCQLDNFENVASWVQEAGTTTESGGRQIAKRVTAIIHDMESISRGRADGMSALREFLLDQRRVSREEVIKKREAARDRRIKDEKKREPPKQAKASQSSNDDNRDVGAFQKSDFSDGRRVCLYTTVVFETI
ncbi:MAG: hypothetical protein Q9180_005021 [Flavoplaca navasiana]